MSKNFQWTTDEETGWVDTRPQPPLPPAPRRRWARVWLLLLVLGIVGWVLLQQANRQVTAVTANVEAEILSSQTLLAQAESRADVELFTTLLSGRDTKWAVAQQTLFQQDLLWDRSSFGLSLLPTAPEVVSVTVSADLQSAEMGVERQYAPLLADGQTAVIGSAVSLVHPLTFRRGETRWLLAPPSAEFWGTWQQAESYYVTLVYPARDEAIALRLVQAMDSEIKQLCRFEPAAVCPSGWQLVVRLDTDPSSLAAAADAQHLFMTNPIFALPAPSLVGLPVDEASYQVLIQAYVGQVLNRAIVEVVATGGRPLHTGG
ncbi:MAG: hypothetical protein IPM39_21495 [Chloroflexi bacterium]|nr:hypothetical protein [Chloroflexota bacterium]